MLSNKLIASNDETEGEDEEISENIIQLNENFQVVVSSHFEHPLWFKLVRIEKNMLNELLALKYPSIIAAVYNPLKYAAEVHCNYLKKFLKKRKHILFIGMNPGAWGMCQTGVPFGHVPAVRDFLRLSGNIGKPDIELPERPVNGFACTRAEQSGARFWGLVEENCKSPEAFSLNCFVHNLCPLAFLKSTGTNITPAEIKGPVKLQVQDICKKYLAETVNLLNPGVIIAVGKYAEDRLKELRKQSLIPKNSVIKYLLHPSPRSVGNQNWPIVAQKWLDDNDISKFMKPFAPEVTV